MTKQQEAVFKKHKRLFICFGLIVLLIAGYFLVGFIYNSLFRLSPSHTMPPQPTRAPQAIRQNSFLPSTDADRVTQDYYNWYLGCLNQHFINQSNRNPQEDCPYNKTGVLTDNLVSKLQHAGEGDPVLCAENIPLKITFDKAVVTNNGKASVIVHTIWGATAPRNIRVGLQAINNQWKISNIACPTIQ